MDRGNFLKILAAGSGSLLFTGLNIGSEQINYDLRKVKIYDNYVRGVHFQKKNFLAVQLKVDDVLNLVRESENKYDRFAIKVEKNGTFLGYIAAYENIVMAMLMDQGVSLEASVSHVKQDIKEKSYLDKVFSVQVFAKLLVPINHLEKTDLAQNRADDAVDIYRKG